MRSTTIIEKEQKTRLKLNLNVGNVQQISTKMCWCKINRHKYKKIGNVLQKLFRATADISTSRKTLVAKNNWTKH